MIYAFGSFQVDVRAAELRLDGEPISLEPKPFALLVHLLAKPDAVATKDELLDALWPDTIVSESALTSAVKLARRALRRGGVSESEGLGIKTVHGRGFRFVGKVTARDVENAARPAPDETAPPAVESDFPPETGIVGRDAELAELDRILRLAGSEGAQIVLVAGEAGMGKTALVDAFVEQLSRAGLPVALGHSVEHYGSAEGYLPVLEALGRVAQGPAGRGLASLMRRVAPTWLEHLPILQDESSEDASVDTPRPAATKDRMLREMAELLEAATAEQPLVVVLEDMHWADHATIELVAYLVQRRSAARVLVLGTYRPLEVTSEEHPLRGVVQGLGVRDRVHDIKLEPLPRDAVAAYLSLRLSTEELDDDLVERLSRRTGGQPLFLTNIVDFALGSDSIRQEGGRWTAAADLEGAVPDDLRQLIERHVEALSSEERSLLEAASAVGTEFSVAAVAAVLDTPLAALEDHCEQLAWRGAFLEDAGVEEWPDGTVAGRYRFLHALYVDVLYARIASSRRVRIHRGLGERKERAFGDRAGEVAGELARHFELARDARHAVDCHEQASVVARGRQAHREAIRHLEEALRLLEGLPADEERDRLELRLLASLVSRFRAARTGGAEAHFKSLERAWDLASRVPDDGHLGPVVMSFAEMAIFAAETRMAVSIGREALATAERQEDLIGAVQCHRSLGVSLQQLGNFPAAEKHYRRTLALYDRGQHSDHVLIYGDVDPAVSSGVFLASTLTDRGYPEKAEVQLGEATALAESLGHPLTIAWTRIMRAISGCRSGDPTTARADLELARALVHEHGFEGDLTVSDMAEAWIWVLEGRFSEAEELLSQVLDASQTHGAKNYEPLCGSLLGAAQMLSGRFEQGLDTWGRAIEQAEKHELPVARGPLLRMRANALVLAGQSDAALPDLEAADSLAREMDDRTGLLEATTILATVLRAQGKSEEACSRLESVYSGFTEGFEYPMVKKAKDLLDELRDDKKP